MKIYAVVNTAQDFLAMLKSFDDAEAKLLRHFFCCIASLKRAVDGDWRRVWVICGNAESGKYYAEWTLRQG